MTEPTRAALHAETVETLAREVDRLNETIKYFGGGSITEGAQDAVRHYAYAAECVKRVPELEAEVERLRAQVKAQRDQLVEGLRDVWGQFSHPMGDGWAHDGGLSTLSWVAEDLVKLGAFEKHPKREWFRAVAAATREGADA